jgi:hypothetical protein
MNFLGARGATVWLRAACRVSDAMPICAKGRRLLQVERGFAVDCQMTIARGSSVTRPEWVRG